MRRSFSYCVNSFGFHRPIVQNACDLDASPFPHRYACFICARDRTLFFHAGPLRLKYWDKTHFYSCRKRFWCYRHGCKPVRYL